MYRLKALDEKTAASLELAQRLITEADFSDQRRLRDLVLEMKNEVDSSLAPSGHSYAALRAGLGFSRSRTVEEIWTGLEQLNFVHAIVDGNIADISRTLTSLRDRIRAGGCIVSITASAESLPGSLKLIEGEWSRFGPPRPRNPASQGVAPFLSLLGTPVATHSAEPSAAYPDGSSASHPAELPVKRPAEVFASPSLQVGFAALALPGASFTSREHAAELVLSHQLSTGALWEDIRMKGGAYGAFAHPDGIEEIFFLSTYRDPNPFRSLGAFGTILNGRAGQKADEDALEKAIIGSYAKETRPHTAAEKGSADFSRFLYGVDDRHRARKLQALIDITDEDLAAAARRLAEAGQQNGASVEASSIIIAGAGAAKEAAARLGVAVQELPV
jgi:Zn-dependent M16 (insulinase) family peptidase